LGAAGPDEIHLVAADAKSQDYRDTIDTIVRQG